jgi:hypothetical protein
MGFFSFKTTDTNKSVSNAHSRRGALAVYLIDNKGNKYYEDDYGGNGRFGGIDIFILIAEMNGHTFDDDIDPDLQYDKLRGIGIDLFYDHPDAVTPNICQKPKEWVNKRLEACEFQGYFY